MHIRSKDKIALVERDGYRYRRFLAELATRGEPLASSEDGFGVLRVFDDVVIDAGARVHVDAHDGFESVVYVLDGECLVEDDRGMAAVVAKHRAARVVLGQDVGHDISNPSSTSALHVLVAAVVAPAANPRPRFVVRSFEGDPPKIVWIASHEVEAQREPTLMLASSARIGIATLEPGGEIEFPRALDRGLYVNVLEGNIEFGSRFVDAGGDATQSRESEARLQSITSSRVVIADVAMGYAQRVS